MSGEWPEDPTDPRCPACGEPVSATAAFCMHCETDLPSADGAVDDAPVDEADPGMPTRDDDAGAASGSLVGSLFDRAPVGPDGGAVERRAEAAAAWVDPDSLLDNVSTAVLGVLTGVVVFVLVVLMTFGLLPAVVDSAAGWLALGAGAATGLWVGRTRSVFDAARKAGYAVGGLLALVPPVLALVLPWESAGDALGGGLVFGVLVWPVALAVAGVGWVLGFGGLEDGG